jgi:SiaC family regulatory phosphoprotein
MEDLHVKMTQQTPEITFKTTGDLSIKGVSIPENTHAFYTTAMEWLVDFGFNLPKTVNLDLDFEYLNTASNRSIIDLIKVISKYKQKRIDLKINWHYEADDEDALELGQDIEFCVDLKFNFVPRQT